MNTIAIVEDNFDYAFILASYLEHTESFHVTHVYHCCDEACRGLMQNPVDIVIVDIQLREKSGIDLMRCLKENRAMRDMRFLVITMHEYDETVFRALHAGANGYILKSARLEQIENALHEVVNGGVPISSFITGKLLKFFISRYRSGSRVDLLSDREKEVLLFISRGMLYKEIAVQLSIQRETVKKHLSKIYEKLEVQNKIEAINKYFGQ